MSFCTADVDRAIVMTQHDLRGFTHPFGFRATYKSSAKSLDATTGNFMAFAAGIGNDGTSTRDHYASYFESSYEDYLSMCQSMAKGCDLSQKEAIQLIVQEIVKQSEEMKAEVAEGKREASAYLRPLDKSNRWGKAVLALAEAFEIKLESVAA